VENTMLSSAQVYGEAIIAVALMVTIGIISGFAAAAFTGDRALTISGGFMMLGLTGAVAFARLWRLMRLPNSDIRPQDVSIGEGS
jgi:FtsH-binding integral membrane protein